MRQATKEDVQRLDKFLIDEGIKEQFVEGLKIAPSRTLEQFYDSLMDPEKPSQLHMGISGAFRWIHTKEGIDFWKVYDDKWHNIMEQELDCEVPKQGYSFEELMVLLAGGEFLNEDDE